MDKWKNGMLMLLMPLVLAACKTLPGGSPDWVDNPKSVYPESKYLVAVGESDTRRGAENSAAANLSRIFEARIDANEILHDQSHETNTELIRTTEFTADINILSSQTLYNVQHAEAWRDPYERYHAVAYLNRRETAAIYRDKINEKTTAVNFLRANAKLEDNLLKKYAFLRAAAGHALEADHLLRQLRVIHQPSVADSTPSYTMSQLNKELAETAKKIVVRVKVDGDSDNRMTATLQEFITGYGFMVGEVPVMDLKAKIEIKDTGERNQGLVFVRYELMLQIRNGGNDVLMTVRNNGREAHKSYEHAVTRSFRTMSSAIKSQAAQRMDAYFDSLIE